MKVLLRNRPLCCLLLALTWLPFFCGVAQAQHEELRFLHVLIVADTLSNIGESCKKDGNNLKNLLEAGTPKNRCEVTVLIKEKVTRGEIFNYFATLKANNKIGPKDGLMFYYAGHGEIRKGDVQDHYLTLSQGQEPHRAISRTELRKAMQACQPGFVVLLTDCCSDVVDRRVTPKVVLPGLKPTLGDRPATIRPAYKHLFFHSRGLVDITAANDGESAFGDADNGGIFTVAFTLALLDINNRLLKAEQEKSEVAVTWTGFYSILKQKTEETHIRLLGEKYKQTSRAFYLPGSSWGFALNTKSAMLEVAEIYPGSPAERAGLKAGDLILRVNNQLVKTGEDCKKAMGSDDRIVQLHVRSTDQEVVRTLQR